MLTIDVVRLLIDWKSVIVRKRDSTKEELDTEVQAFLTWMNGQTFTCFDDITLYYLHDVLRFLGHRPIID